MILVKFERKRNTFFALTYGEYPLYFSGKTVILKIERNENTVRLDNHLRGIRLYVGR